jgi:ubiquinone/menaquinone biosynthesis C-methylase UbiE
MLQNSKNRKDSHTEHLVEHNSIMNKKCVEQTEQEYKQKRIQHWDTITEQGLLCSITKTFRERTKKILKFAINPGLRVLEIGCGEGDLLASLQPVYGVGIDFSQKLIEKASNKYHNLKFFQVGTHELTFLQGETFDFVIISRMLNDFWDPQAILEQVRLLCKRNTRLIMMNSYGWLWKNLISLTKKCNFFTSTPEQNRLTRKDVETLLRISHFELIREWQELIIPINIPVLFEFINTFLVKFWPFNHLAILNFTLARPFPFEDDAEQIVSIVIPARDEAGNIPALFERMPEFGKDMELILIEGHSTDDTYNVIYREIQRHPDRKCLLLRQENFGKADAIRTGFEHSTGGILLIFDADLTVSPEVLPRFYDALISGKGDFINGDRLTYPLNPKSMRFTNLVGNKFFSLAFSWILDQPIKDPLCGIKAFWRQDYLKISHNRTNFGNFDPFGDFDLILGAGKLNLKLLNLPVRYQERIYGITKTKRIKHGWLLLKMVVLASIRLKFI